MNAYFLWIPEFLFIKTTGGDEDLFFIACLYFTYFKNPVKQNSTAGYRAIFGWNCRFFLLPEKKSVFFGLLLSILKINRQRQPHQFSFPEAYNI
jgi:hypothetical protein